MYCAIIGDIVGSKSLAGRGDVQRKLKHILDTLSDSYKKNMASPFTITLGDEFQGLFRSPDNILDILDTIKLEMHPVEVRFGIGFGEIVTDIDSDISIGADGPAYYSARRAIDDIKMVDKRYEMPVQDMKICGVNAGYCDYVGVINSGLSLMTLIKKKWTLKQREAIKLSRNSDVSQREIASKLDVEQSTVYRRLAAAGYYTYISGVDATQKAIDDLWERINEKYTTDISNSSHTR